MMAEMQEGDVPHMAASTLAAVDPFEPAQPTPAAPVEAPAFQEPSVETTAVEILPTMADLDRLAGDLDRVDLTLAQLDDPTQARELSTTES